MKLFEVEYPRGFCYIVRAPDEETAIELTDKRALSNGGCATEFYSTDGPAEVLEKRYLG